MATMCSYAGLNSVPSCANDYLLNKVLRQKFNRSEILVASDCGAIENMFEYMKYTKNEVESAAKSMNGGCDIDLGDEIYSPIKNGGKGSIGKAIKHKMISLKRLDESVRRVLNLRFLVGLFDPLE